MEAEQASVKYSDAVQLAEEMKAKVLGEIKEPRVGVLIRIAK